MHPTTLAALDMWPLILTFLVAVFIPWLSELVTASTAHPALRYGLTTVLSAVTGVLSELQVNSHYNWKIGFIGAAEAVVVALLTHANLWTPLTILDRINQAVPAGVRLPSDQKPPSRHALAA